MAEPTILDDEMRAEYDFSRATRGNPYKHLADRHVKIETTDGDDRHIQIQTVELTAIIAADGTTTLQLPPEITPGEHRITLLIQVEQPSNLVAAPQP
jgi:hypothetical protein